MTVSATGLILRTRPLTETSLIVHWLTAHCGRIATVAKGARRPKSPFGGKLDLFYLADFSFSRSQRSDLHNLREVKLIETHSALRDEILKLRQAAYAAGFIEQATETDTPMPEIYELARGFLTHLCKHISLPQSIFALELKLLRELGLEPDLETARLTPGTKKIMRGLTEKDWNRILQLKLSAAQTGELRQFLHGFLIFHLGRLPRGRAAATAENGSVVSE
jgi:DNA repair protein RecO (recombination protein O)